MLNLVTNEKSKIFSDNNWSTTSTARRMQFPRNNISNRSRSGDLPRSRNYCNSVPDRPNREKKYDVVKFNIYSIFRIWLKKMLVNSWWTVYMNGA